MNTETNKPNRRITTTWTIPGDIERQLTVSTWHTKNYGGAILVSVSRATVTRRDGYSVTHSRIPDIAPVNTRQYDYLVSRYSFKTLQNRHSVALADLDIPALLEWAKLAPGD